MQHRVVVVASMNTLKELQAVKREDLLKIARMMNLKTSNKNHEDDIISKILLCDDERIYQALKTIQAENFQKITATMKKKKKIQMDAGRMAVESAINAIRMDYLMRTSKVASEIENIAMMISGSNVCPEDLRKLCEQLITLENTDLRPLHRAVQETRTLLSADNLCSNEIKENLENILDKMNKTLVRSEGMKILEQKIRECYNTDDWKTLRTLFRVLEERLKNGIDI